MRLQTLPKLPQSLPELLQSPPKLPQSLPELPQGCQLFLGVTKITKYCKKQQKCTIWNSSADPADLLYQVSLTAARTPLPHAPGVRMT